MQRRGGLTTAISFASGTHAGRVLGGAVVSDGIRPGVFCIHQGAWPDLALDEGGISKNGAVNVLTKDLPSSKLGNGCAGNTGMGGEI